MKKRLFPFIVALAALSVAGSAAFYSVFGLSKLFAGASTQVIIMAGSLEFAKLVVASLLYQYWDTINKWLRSYLAIAVFVLMVITSGGIYGFLSGAYQSTATKSELLDKSLLILEQKQVRFEDSKEDLTLEKIQINQSISDLRTSLSNPHSVSWYDKNSETVITSSSGSARRALQAELKTTITDRDNINLKLEAVLDSIGKTDMALLEKEISNEDQRELGPLKYLASTTGWPMDKVVNYFLLLIIFVFDPLAIALVVSANMAFAQIAPKRKEEDYFISRNEHLEKIIEMEPPVGLREEDNTTEPSESLKQRVKENQDKLKEIDEDYFSELEGYMKYIREEDMENLTYPQFVEKHYPEGIMMEDGGGIESIVEPTHEQILEEGTEEPRVIKSENDLNKKELEELSKEVGRLEKEIDKKGKDKINPTDKDLEKLAQALKIVNDSTEPEEVTEDIKEETNKLDLEEFFLKDNDTTQRKQLYDLLVANGYDKAFLRKSDSVHNPDDVEIKKESDRYSEDDIEDYRLTDTTQTLITEITKEAVDETKTHLKYTGRK